MIKPIVNQAIGFYICVEGISQAEMLAFLFDAAHEREKFAKRASHRYRKLYFLVLVFCILHVSRRL